MLDGAVIYQAWSRIDPASEQANACVEQVRVYSHPSANKFSSSRTASYRLNCYKSIRATVWFLGVLSGTQDL